jgi:hypothetical protein
MIKTVFTSLFSLLVIYTTAQEELVDKQKMDNTLKHHALGFNAGFSTGFGISYRYQYNKHSYQMSLLPIIENNYQVANLGFRYAYNFSEMNRTRFFGYAGHSAFIVPKNDKPLIRLVTGVGFGIEQDLTKSLALNFGAGYAYYTREYPNNILSLTAELGLFYKFN